MWFCGTALKRLYNPVLDVFVRLTTFHGQIRITMSVPSHGCTFWWTTLVPESDKRNEKLNSAYFLPPVAPPAGPPHELGERGEARAVSFSIFRHIASYVHPSSINSSIDSSYMYDSQVRRCLLVFPCFRSPSNMSCLRVHYVDLQYDSIALCIFNMCILLAFTHKRVTLPVPPLKTAVPPRDYHSGAQQRSALLLIFIRWRGVVELHNCTFVRYLCLQWSLSSSMNSILPRSAPLLD